MIKIFRNIRHKLLSEGKTINYLKYAIGEIVLVVIGILIALQVNNWNEKRKSDERFLFGLRELYGEIKATSFYENTMQDKMQYQLIRIDSILYHPNAIPVKWLPGLIQLFDENALDEKDNSWKEEYLEFVPGDEKRNQMARALRTLAFGYNDLKEDFKEHQLYRIMSSHLQKYSIPIQIYSAGTGYEEFLNQNNIEYTSQQLQNVKQLVHDPSFIAALMSLKNIKQNVVKYAHTVGFSANSFLNYVKQYDPKTNYELTHMEIIGTGLPEGQWASGIPMHRVEDSNENIWEIKQQLVDGLIKFRADEEWLLDWGKGESNPKSLVFKGGDIAVKKGYYRIRINIAAHTMQFTPIKND